MLSIDLRETINERAREFDVKAVWLFGSSLQDDPHSRDIDLAVEGIPPELFFKFYARLFIYKNYLKGMSKPEALRKAQLAMQETKKWSHPYYWSAFVLFGDWE